MIEVNLNCETEVKPNKYIIENILDDKCDIVLNDNITEKIKENEDGESKTYYIYDMYRIVNNTYRDNLKEELEQDANKWLNYAKNIIKEEKTTTEKEWRNAELEKTDKYMLEDYPIKYKKETITAYRQALRNYPEQEDFPYGERPKIQDYILTSNPKVDEITVYEPLSTTNKSKLIL